GRENPNRRIRREVLLEIRAHVQAPELKHQRSVNNLAVVFSLDVEVGMLPARRRHHRGGDRPAMQRHNRNRRGVTESAGHRRPAPRCGGHELTVDLEDQDGAWMLRWQVVAAAPTAPEESPLEWSQWRMRDHGVRRGISHGASAKQSLPQMLIAVDKTANAAK